MRFFISLEVINILLLSCFASVTTSQAVKVVLLGQTASLPCLFAQRSQNDLTATWTKKGRTQLSDKSLFVFHGGKRMPDHQTEEYRDKIFINQTGLSDGNATLFLKNISISDDGVYECFVFMNPEKHNSTLKLEVAALFSKPQVSCQQSPSSQKDEKMEEWILSCVSENGYPEGRLLWDLEDGLDVHSRNQTNQTKETWGLYTLRSQLVINRSFSKNPSCIVHNQRAQQTISSVAVCNVSDKAAVNQTPAKPRHRLAIVASVLGYLCFLLPVVIRTLT